MGLINLLKDQSCDNILALGYNRMKAAAHVALDVQKHVLKIKGNTN